MSLSLSNILIRGNTWDMHWPRTTHHSEYFIPLNLFFIFSTALLILLSFYRNSKKPWGVNNSIEEWSVCCYARGDSGNFDNNQKKNKAGKTINKTGAFCFVWRQELGRGSGFQAWQDEFLKTHRDARAHSFNYPTHTNIQKAPHILYTRGDVYIHTEI